MRFSPAILTMANVLLAVLWACSAFANWGVAAFCDPGADPTCAGRVRYFGLISVIPAAFGLVLALGSYLAPNVRRDPETRNHVLAYAAVAWIIAEAIVFLGGYASTE
ncbi:MAG: hypothetical protein GEV11_27145 [Streptosporangiales bacterium]|nr:hypothetical protein [Streptosporangiales bacterium]